MDALADAASEYYEMNDQLAAKRAELSELRTEIFDTDSKEIEEQARSLFESFGDGETDGRLDEIQALESEIDELENQLEEAEQELREALAEITFPFDETIDGREERVAFPFSNPLPDSVVQAIEDSEPTEADSSISAVTVTAEEITVETTDISEAIDTVEQFVETVQTQSRQALESDGQNENTEGESQSAFTFT